MGVVQAARHARQEFDRRQADGIQDRRSTGAGLAVRILSPVFRAKLLGALEHALASGKILTLSVAAPR